MLPIAIIGAGLAGLTAGRLLAAAGRPVRLFDKGRGVGGRLATRRITHDGASHGFDHGAQYLRAEGKGFAALLEEVQARPWPDALRRVAAPSMSALGRALAGGLDVATGCEVRALRRTPEAWFLDHAAGAEGPFAAVLVTTPAPQAIPLMDPHAPGLAQRLADIRYAPNWTVMAAFAGRLPLPDTLRHRGVLGWAARDSSKPGRDAAQENWVLQANSTFSAEHLESPPEAVIPPLLAALLPGGPAPLFAVAHRWRYALLQVPLGEPCLWDGALGYASDGCLAGRAEAAFDSGAGPPGAGGVSARPPRPAHADDLGAVRAEAFALLARGVADRRSPFHTPTLATIGIDGAPRARTLVLRGFDAPTRSLRLHSDARSAKRAELARDPRACLHLYDAGRQVQLRLEGTASLHREDDLADAAWHASRPFSRLCYAIEPAPGTPVALPPPAPAEEGEGRAHFMALRLAFDRMEWLWLSAQGHRRARFAWNAAGEEEATWLVP